MPALGSGSGNVIQSNVNTAGFIPEVWSDEIIAAYKKNLVAANLIKKMNMKGKKGDVVHFPAPARASAAVKAANTQVTVNAESGTEKTVTINKHYEYSRLIEDFAEVQALSSLRRFYTEDAGYSLATQIDTDVVRLGRLCQGGTWNGTDATFAYANGFIGGDGSTAFDATANTNTGNETALTDAGIRRAIQRLDDQDVPMSGRFFIVPPVARNVLMGLARFTEQAFTGEQGTANTIRNGQIGDIYGVKVYVSTNADTATTSDSGDVNPRVCLMAHPEFGVLVEQLGIRVQTQYKQEYLGTLLTADTLYGVGELRDSSAVALVIPG
jgi:N4-gp56 family major capsid protein